MVSLFHYSDSSELALRDVDQEINDKPTGLWLSVGGDWERWCRAEDFGLNKLQFRHKVWLRKNCILCLGSSRAITDFSEEFGRSPEGWKGEITSFYIDWRAVSSRFRGILIYPYQWECRLNPDVRWYYGWDCASGCVWDKSAIERMEIDHEYRPAT